MRPSFVLLSLFALLALAASAAALSSDDVAVVVNVRNGDGRAVADHYVAARGLAPEQVVEVNVTTAETISRAEYDDLEAQLAAALGGWEPEVLVLTQGLPLRVNSDDTWDYYGNQSSVDAELALLHSPLAAGNDGRHTNPYHYAAAPFVSADNDGVMLVARLAGANVSVAKALVDRALAAEADGSIGWGAFDGDAGMGSSYRWYDDDIHDAYNLTRDRGLPGGWESSSSDLGYGGAEWANASAELPPANDTVDPYFYWGWYSDASYHDTFDWPIGAVGMRLHSFNAKTLGTGSWVGGAVADGLTGTTGHVWEPWLDAAALPSLFFARTYEGFTLAEAAWAATPYLSWQNVVVGDPLYRPLRVAANATVVAAPAAAAPESAVNLTLNVTLDSPLAQEITVNAEVEGVPGATQTRHLLLPAGGSQVINLSLPLPMLPPGNYTLRVTTEQINGQRTVQVRTVVITELHRLALDSAGPAAAVAPGDGASFSVEVRNTGNVFETFAVNGSAERGGLSVSPDELTLAPGETAYCDATVSLSLDMTLAPGQQLALGLALAGNLSLAWHGNLTVAVVRLLDVTPPGAVALAGGWVAGTSVTLVNRGNAELVVNLQAYPPAWLSMTPEHASVTLAPGAAATQNYSLWAASGGAGATLLAVSFIGNSTDYPIPVHFHDTAVTLALDAPAAARGAFNITAIAEAVALPPDLPAELVLSVAGAPVEWWSAPGERWLNGSAADTTRSWTATLVLAPGTHQVAAQVVLPPGVATDTAAQRIARATVAVYAPLELAFDDVWLEAAPGGGQRLVATLSGDGGPVPPFEITVVREEAVVQRWTIDALPARVELPLAGTGVGDLTVTLDAGNAVAEPDETNNVAVVAIPSGDDEEESGLPGPSVVLGALALLGAARRRRARWG